MGSLFTVSHLILPATSGLVVKNMKSGAGFQASSYTLRKLYDLEKVSVSQLPQLKNGDVIHIKGGY